jgi:hypothetical protein
MLMCPSANRRFRLRDSITAVEIGHDLDIEKSTLSRAAS